MISHSSIVESGGGEGQVAAAPCKLVCQSREDCAPGKLASARRGERRARGPSALALIIVLSGCFSRHVCR